MAEHKPDTVIGEDDPVAVMQPGVDLAMYPVIVAGTPAQDGAVKDMLADPVAATVAVPIVGGNGAVGHRP